MLELPVFHNEEVEIPEKNIVIDKLIGAFRGCDEEGSAITCDPGLLGYNVRQRNGDKLKIAYIKFGSVSVGWHETTPTKGIYIEEQPISEEKSIPRALTKSIEEKLIDCDVPEKIREEFGISIGPYLRIRPLKYYETHFPEKFGPRGEYARRS